MTKMNVERAMVEQALEQALEALEDLRVWYHKQMTAVFAIRAQLAEPQEPVQEPTRENTLAAAGFQPHE